jgi:tetratricopeptide (TPR) repeat protein
VALENARVGQLRAALELLDRARVSDADRPLGQTACALIADYHMAVVLDRLGETDAAVVARARGSSGGDRAWSFPARLDDVAALEAALAAEPTDATAAALLGHWCYAHGRPDEALRHWRRSAELDPSDPVVWRNLGVGAYNHDHDPEAAQRGL